jgi:hypothetical protein
VTAKAHGKTIDIQGVTVAQVDDQVRLQKVETWFDPMEMFRQIAPNGIVNKAIKNLESLPMEPASIQGSTSELSILRKKDKDEATRPASKQSAGEKETVTGSGSCIDEKRHAAENDELLPGNALAVPPGVEQTVMTHEEMSKITPSECPFMNKE